ncbi:GDSL-type esterase/lipase family protein [Streptomyces sp. NBC_01102]|uniref:GDSL-type esterase/lipase family protein n=1 Tax=unclassified Streptomyces TaxID=2593676 RepID=UPI0038694F8B|nr:GDSL-type esterase/lipase family protein [Streptomyces sp. NBC_01102]
MSGPAASVAGAGGTEWLSPDDPRLSWDGVAQAEWSKEGWLPRRIPRDRLATTLSPNFARLAAMPAGIRCGVRTDAEELVLRLIGEAGSAPVDIRVDGVLVRRAEVAGEREITVALTPAAGAAPSANGADSALRAVEVWLPNLGFVLVAKIGFRGHGTLLSAQRPGPRWVTYGSSLTHSMFAAGPSETWTALVAAGQGWRLHNLGFAGEAHLDPLVARTIRNLPADLISLELGINVYTRDTFSARSWAPAVCGFIDTIRDGHPDVPIAVITPLSSPDRERAANNVGLTLEQVRAYTAEAVRVLEGLGDKNLCTVDGLSVVPVSEAAEVFADGLHPTAAGEHVLADRIGSALRKALLSPV